VQSLCVRGARTVKHQVSTTREMLLHDDAANVSKGLRLLPPDEIGGAEGGIAEVGLVRAEHGVDRRGDQPIRSHHRMPLPRRRAADTGVNGPEIEKPVANARILPSVAIKASMSRSVSRSGSNCSIARAAWTMGVAPKMALLP